MTRHSLKIPNLILDKYRAPKLIPARESWVPIEFLEGAKNISYRPGKSLMNMCRDDVNIPLTEPIDQIVRTPVEVTDLRARQYVESIRFKSIKILSHSATIAMRRGKTILMKGRREIYEPSVVRGAPCISQEDSARFIKRLVLNASISPNIASD